MISISIRIGKTQDAVRSARIIQDALNKQNINVIFFTEDEYVKNELERSSIKCFNLAEKCNRQFSDVEKGNILTFIESKGIADLNYFLYTQKSFYPNNKYLTKQFEETVFSWLSKAIDIYNSGFKSDYFFDFAGDEVPHTVFRFICIMTSGKYISYRESVFPDRIGFIKNNIGVWEIPEVPDELYPSDEEKQYISEFIDKYLKEKKVFWGDPQSRDFKLELIKKRNLKNKIFNKAVVKNFYNNLKRVIIKKYANIYYYNVKVLENKEYFYFPLHYPFDSNLVYRGKPFKNQVAFIEMLSSYLPYNKYLVVKEHPHARGALTLDKLNILKSLDRIIILHPWINSHLIIKNAKVVFVINSTVALEAIYNGVPVVSFGRNYFTGHKIINNITGFYELEKVFNTQNLTRPSTEDLFKWLIQAYRYSVPLDFKRIISGQANNSEYLLLTKKLVEFIYNI